MSISSPGEMGTAISDMTAFAQVIGSRQWLDQGMQGASGKEVRRLRREGSEAHLRARSTPVFESPTHLQFAPEVQRLSPYCRTAVSGDEALDRVQDALARAPVALRMDGIVRIAADGVHELRRPKEREFDRWFQLFWSR